MKHRVRRSKSEWETIIRKQAASGLNVVKFCKSESISVSSFHRWRHRLSDMSGILTRTADTDAAPMFINMGSVDEFGVAGCDAGLGSSSSRVLELTLDLGLGVKLTLKRS